MNKERRTLLKLIGTAGLSLAVGGFLPKKALADYNNYQEIPWGSNTRTKKIIYLESKGNPLEINRKSLARGLMQITEVVLNEWNANNPKNFHYALELYIPEINIKIGEFYLKRIEKHYLPHYKLSRHDENILTAWNKGIGFLEKNGDAKNNFHELPHETKKFIRDYKKLSS